MTCSRRLSKRGQQLLLGGQELKWKDVQGNVERFFLLNVFFVTDTPPTRTATVW